MFRGKQVFSNIQCSSNLDNNRTCRWHLELRASNIEIKVHLSNKKSLILIQNSWILAIKHDLKKLSMNNLLSNIKIAISTTNGLTTSYKPDAFLSIWGRNRSRESERYDLSSHH